jgi:hypothetical protein
MKIYKTELESFYSTSDGTTFTYTGCFRMPLTQVFLLNPSLTTPTQTFTESELNSNFLNNYQNDFICNCTHMKATDWDSVGWTSGDENTTALYFMVTLAEVILE